MSASGSVTVTHNERTVTDFSQTFACAGGSIVKDTSPLPDPLTSQRPNEQCTPAAYTRALVASALLIDVKGMSAVNAHPILT